MMLRPLELFGRLCARPVLRLRAHRPARWLTVLLYHRVLPGPPSGFALDPEVIDCDPAGFDDQMRLVASTCTPIDLGLLLGYLRGETPLPRNPVLVTFDDGYRDGREHALPVLRRHGIRAVFFVASGYVEGRRLFWWDRIRYLVHHARVGEARLRYPSDLLLRVGTDRAAVARAALGIVKTCRGLDVERFLGELGRALEVPWERALERRLADEHVMTWDDVRALHAAGMDVGSHTRTHRVLDTVEPVELHDELAGSRADIERAVGGRVAAIAYPVGRSIRRVPLLARAVRDARYEVGFAVGDRANPLAGPALAALDVARLGVDARTSLHRLAARLAAPELMGIA